MPNYRRDYAGTGWSFTVVTAGRRLLLDRDDARSALRQAISECRSRYPFRVDAWVLMPDHLHCIWTMPEEDRDYSRRWSLIKRRFTQHMTTGLGGAHGAPYADSGGPEVCGAHGAPYADSDEVGPPYWQARFWAHRIDDERDYAAHVDYIHFNPVKHGAVARVADWPWSTFHRYAAGGILAADWGGDVSLPPHVGRE